MLQRYRVFIFDLQSKQCVPGVGDVKRSQSIESTFIKYPVLYTYIPQYINESVISKRSNIYKIKIVWKRKKLLIEIKIKFREKLKNG
jgi:hypothetical protein